jgi:hypothetical protein
MDTHRIRMSYSRDEKTPPNIFTDHDWVRQHEKELLEQYGECSIIVYREKVIGVGKSYQEALEDAERNLPPDVTEITPIHEWLYRRHPFFRALPGALDVPSQDRE